MRRLVILVLLAVLARSASAEPPGPAPSPDAVADAVVAAVKANDAKALAALAAKDEPDPWMVADALLARGEAGAASAFAKAAPRLDVERLPDYVAAWKPRDGDAERRKRLAEANAALGSQDPRRVAALLQAPAEAGKPVDVLSVRLAFTRGMAALSFGKGRESAPLFMAAAEASEAMGWLSRLAGALRFATDSYERFFDHPTALRVSERWLALARRRGDAHDLGQALLLGGLSLADLGQNERALASLLEAREILVKVGDKEQAAWALAEAGMTRLGLGEHAAARADMEKAKAEQEALGDEWRLAATLGNLATARGEMGDFHEAFELFAKALALVERLGNKQSVAASHMNIGNLHHQLGQFQKALEEHTKALEMFTAMGNAGGVAVALGNIGNDHDRLGNVPMALDFQERALAARERIGDRAGVGNTLSNLATMHHSIGEKAKAEAYARRALEIAEKGSNPPELAVALSGLATILDATERSGQALPLKERVLAIREKSGNPAWIAAALADIGTIKMKLGDHDGAAKAIERALAMQEKLGNHEAASHSATNLGFLHATRGDLAAAAKSFERAISEAELGDAPGGLVYACAVAAKSWASTGDDRRALAAAKKGLENVRRLLGGLADEQAAQARLAQIELFSWGALVAARLGDAAAALRFLEDGRAGAFLESMRTRDALRGTALPPALVEAEASARRKEAAAATAYRAAVAAGDRDALVTAREGLEASNAAVQAVVERIQREQKRAAAVLYPRSDDAKAIAGRLGPGDALVLYSLHVGEAVAVVVTEKGARAVLLGKSQPIRDACEALGLSDPSEPVALAPDAVERVRALAMTPLGLGPETKRLLVSPEGSLSYVPFALLAPDKEVAHVPSGTTLGLLREDAGPPGKGVLALGDPDYAVAAEVSAASVFVRSAGKRGGAFALVPLPRTRDEVLAVGDSTLVGRDASEARFRDALRARKGRLRGVHFACHGLVDPEHPGLCSLAVTPAPPDDGFLTATEILRTQIPADLVVLSACETGRGRIFDGEGILGLTRAFMYAGSPRVLCSLWKVDDEATGALMTKFYALWNPKDGSNGLSPAAALRAAQAFVRSQEKWKHPYFWAAWVLWGLPD